MRKLSSRPRTSSTYMYSKLFQDGPLPWAAYSNAQSPFQWRNLSLISSLKVPWFSFSPVLRGSPQEDLINRYKYLKGECKEDKFRPFTVVSTVWILNIRKICFTVRITEHWHSLPRKAKSCLWRYTKASWTVLSYCLKVSFSSVVRPGDFPRSTQTFCDSVCVWSGQLCLRSLKSKVQRRN